ncbi:MAG: hypothetical protein V8Q84_07370 [Bilophila sp.]
MTTTGKVAALLTKTERIQRVMTPKMKGRVSLMRAGMMAEQQADRAAEKKRATVYNRSNHGVSTVKVCVGRFESSVSGNMHAGICQAPKACPAGKP